MGRRRVAVFDFDGTLTRRDTLPEFVQFACGKWRARLFFLLYTPVIALVRLRLYPNWKAKETLFAFFFKGMGHQRFQELGRDFASVIEGFKREETLRLAGWHADRGDRVYVVSASIEEWVRPWCEQHRVGKVIGTKIEVDGDGLLTGRFLSANCYGQEKVNRLLQVEPDRDDYFLYAYGDSRGDREMIAFADRGEWL
jgi:HAD superfamily hydrolase (TIGR01490 family)